MKKNTRLRTWILLALALSPFGADAQLLKGTAEGDVETLQVAFSREGDPLTVEYIPVPLAEDGTFAFDMELREPSKDVILYIGDKDLCGMHLVEGETLTLAISRGENGVYSYAFGGKETLLSEVCTKIAQAFDLMRYLPMDVSQTKPYSENRAILDKKNGEVKKAVEAITDKKTREHYARMARAQYNYVLASLIQNEATEQEKNVVEFPEYVEIMRTNDMNDEFNLESGLSYLIVRHKAGTDANFGGDMTPYCLAIMNVADSLATPAAKKAFARLCAFQYFSFGAAGNDEVFWNRFKTFAADYPELIAQYQGNIEARAKTTQGKATPDATMTRPDGTTCRLSELFGKFLYIDVWATWCGPCCAEIPYLEKVAAHFKGNDKVAVVSISIDTDKEAWAAKLKADQPEWLQFILTPEEAAAFQQAWGIQGIPRFIMIDAEGKIFNADAPRPSDEDTIGIIEEQIN